MLLPMKNKILKTLSVLGLALSTSFAFGGAMTEQDRKNSKYLQDLIERYSGNEYTTGSSKIDDNFSDLKEYLDILQQGLRPDDVRGKGRQNRFIKKALKGKLDFDQIMELFYRLNIAADIAADDYGITKAMMKRENQELVKAVLNEWDEEFSPVTLEVLRGNNAGMNSLGGLSIDQMQDELDVAEEYLNAWPNLHSVQGNWLVDGKYSLPSVVQYASAAKCGLVKARIREAQRQREMAVSDDEREEL